MQILAEEVMNSNNGVDNFETETSSSEVDNFETGGNSNHHINYEDMVSQGENIKTSIYTGCWNWLRKLLCLKKMMSKREWTFS